jgi:riboflavin synthase
MFTGLIEAIGTVGSLERSGRGALLRVTVEWPDAEVPVVGDSIAVNGACLTALEPSATSFAADLSPETLERTLLGELRAGAPVNLERALRLGDRLGGHLVQGHVDAEVRLLAIRPEPGARTTGGRGFERWRLELPRAHAAEVAEKGSVTVHGVSLTVATLGEGWLEVALIPETLRATVLGTLQAGARLHLETDVLAKYVARSLGSSGRSVLAELFGEAPAPGGRRA